MVQPVTDEIDFIDYLKVIYKKRLIVMAIVLISVFYTAYQSLNQPEMYEASATFFPLKINESSSSPSGLFPTSGQLNVENLIISLLESRKMVDRIVEQLALRKVWNIALMSGVRSALDSATQVSVEKNGLIKVSVTTESPKLSADIANAYVDSLNFFNQQLEIAAQRSIVQVIDRADIPETRKPRGTTKKIMVAAMGSFIFSVFLAFLIEFIQKSDLVVKLRKN